VNRLLKLAAVSALGCAAWSVYCHGRTVHPPDGVLVEGWPAQHNYVDDKPVIRRGAWTLTPRAHYDITGRVLQLVAYSDVWSDLAPVDLSLGWQEMSDNANLARFTITERDRTLLVDSIDKSIKDFYPFQVRSSNNHLIPEDGAIESSIRGLKVGQVVELEGELVDVAGPDYQAHTSLLRNDVGDYACEILLVRRVKVKY
jgi:hypothetical protein